MRHTNLIHNSVVGHTSTALSLALHVGTAYASSVMYFNSHSAFKFTQEDLWLPPVFNSFDLETATYKSL